MTASVVLLYSDIKGTFQWYPLRLIVVLSAHITLCTIYLRWRSLDAILLKLNCNDEVFTSFFYSALDVGEIPMPHLTKRCKQSARE